jgi:hypothetical protein
MKSNNNKKHPRGRWSLASKVITASSSVSLLLASMSAFPFEIVRLFHVILGLKHIEGKMTLDNVRVLLHELSGSQSLQRTIAFMVFFPVPADGFSSF